MTYIDKFMSKQAFEEALFMLGFIETCHKLLSDYKNGEKNDFFVWDSFF